MTPKIHTYINEPLFPDVRIHGCFNSVPFGSAALPPIKDLSVNYRCVQLFQGETKTAVSAPGLFMPLCFYQNRKNR